MKAVRIHEFGGPNVLQLEETPRPEPQVGEVLVRVHAAAVNPVDWKIRQGHRGIQVSLPLTIGWDFSGVIEKVGPDVDTWKAGDEVYTRPAINRDGAYAEFIVVPAKDLAAKPKHLDHVHAAAVPLAGLTAWQALFEHGRLKPGQTVLIHAASGGVGGYAVQLAKYQGARVIATTSAKNAGYVKNLGADEIIDHESERFEERVHNVDVVIDTLGGEVQERSWGVLKKNGVLVSTVGEPPQDKAKQHGVEAVGFMAQTNIRQLEEMAQLLDKGALRSLAETVMPLSAARKAHELSQEGHVRGKIVLKVTDAPSSTFVHN
jgi:NADPH:quinone reductase-like Zn-dependent oxidoreductase